MRNLLLNREERIFFKDGKSRFLLVGAGWLAAEGQGRSLDEVIGKTDFEIFSRLHADAAFEDERRVIETGEPIVAKIERETFDDRPDAWVSTTRLPLRDEGGGVIGTWGIARDVTAEIEGEETIRRNAEGQEEIAELGRLALRGESLEQLFDCAVGAAWRVLSSDCAWLVERLQDGSGTVVRAEIGWPEEREGEQITREARSLSGLAVRSRGPVVVDDWELERRFLRSRKRLTRGVRSSVGVLVGNPDSPFGLLEVQYTQPHAVPPDCLPFLNALANVLAEAIQGRNAQEMIKHQALHDGLTGLPNRALILDRVERALAHARRHKSNLGVLFLDVDGFKAVNDSLGHAAGDDLLCAVSARLRGLLRENDTVGRLGGDEFVVVAEGDSLDAGAEVIADRIREVLATPFTLGDAEKHSVEIRTSIGIAMGLRASAEELLRDADIALYEAKDGGGDRFVLFAPEMHTVMEQRRELENDLRHAIDDEQVFLVYQPTFDLASTAINGVEALVRWRHPTHGLVMPDDFIPLAETTGLIIPLGRWILDEACRQGADWQGDQDSLNISVNVSGRQLGTDTGFVAHVEAALTDSGLLPGSLTLEISESVLMRDAQASAPQLRADQSLSGIRLLSGERP
jgi:diguanylate cyclase (GGDEF)-like protein/PAS domain S-box-containing protein